MKKLLLVFTSLVILATGLFAQAATDFNSAISTSAREISSALPANSNVAIVNFFSDTEELSTYIANQMIKGIKNSGKVKVLERDPKKMALVDAEQDYQYSGAVSDSSMVEIGYKLGAQYLVYGTFDQLGGMLQFSVQATNVETAEILYYQSYTIQSSAAITQLLGEKMELATLNDFLEAIARCDRKISALEANKNSAVDNSNEALMAKYAEQMQAVYSIEKEPWESTAEYDDKIQAKIDALTKKRDGELAAISSVSSPKFDQQIKAVEAQRKQIVTDLKNTTFVLKNASVQTFIGEFDAESKPKNYPVSVKSLDKYVSYIYNGKYTVNDADVKTEYKVVEAARAANDLAGEIRYKVIQSTTNSSSFDIYVDSVRLNIASSGSVLVNESVKKVTGSIDAAKVVEGGNSGKAKTTTTTTTKTTTTATTTKKATSNTPATTSLTPAQLEAIAGRLEKTTGRKVTVTVDGNYLYMPKVEKTGATLSYVEGDGYKYIRATRNDDHEVRVTFLFSSSVSASNFSGISYDIKGFNGGVGSYNCCLILGGRKVSLEGRKGAFESDISMTSWKHISKRFTETTNWGKINNDDLIYGIQFWTDTGTDLYIANVDLMKLANTSATKTNTTTATAKANPFEDKANFRVGVDQNSTGKMTASSVEYEGKRYDSMHFSGRTGKKTKDGGWVEAHITSETKKLKPFLTKGDTIKFKILGDGNYYTIYFQEANNPGGIGTRFEKTGIQTKKGKVVEVEIPYSKMNWVNWTKKNGNKIDINNIDYIAICADTWKDGYYHEDKDYEFDIFDVRVYNK